MIVVVVGDAKTFTGEATQGHEPDWLPLLELLGEELAGEFMWMFEARLSDGSRVHAYKHIDTRACLHLAATGRAYVYRPPNRYELFPVALLSASHIPLPEL